MSDPADNTPEDEANAQRKHDEQLIRRFLVQLSEHFDAVQIFATRMDQEHDTHTFSMGTGNWYARRGMVEDWIVARNAETAHNAVRTDE